MQLPLIAGLATLGYLLLRKPEPAPPVIKMFPVERAALYQFTLLFHPPLSAGQRQVVQTALIVAGCCDLSSGKPEVEFIDSDAGTVVVYQMRAVASGELPSRMPFSEIPQPAEVLSVERVVS